MAETDTPSDGEAPEVTDDPMTVALQQAQKQAEARKAIAEAQAATAKAMLPTLPEELGSTLDVTGAGTTFGTVNCYRAALECTSRIANEVKDLLASEPVWIVPGPATRSPFEVLAGVNHLLDELKDQLSDAIDRLRSPAVPASGSSAPQPRVRPSAMDAAVIAALVSAGVSLVSSLFSSKVTIKSGSAELDDDAVVDLMTRALLDANCAVVRPDPNAPVDNTLVESVGQVRDLIEALRHETWNVILQAQTAQAEMSKRVTERDVLKSKVQALAESSGKDFAPDLSVDITRIVTLAGEIADEERKKAILDARLADAQSLTETAGKALDALFVAGTDGFTPIGFASVAARRAPASTLRRLEVTAVSAGSDSQYHDRKVRPDYAFHTGSATVTYRLLDGSGNVQMAQTFVALASCRVGLDGKVEWVE